MNISRVIIHGFRSYKDTVSFGPFSPGQNALVGMNGSGKSNFYKAIEFVLLDEYAHIRVTDRKSILHEGTATSAYVEIIFNNTGEHRPIPIDQDEVSIRRSVSLKKDEYFINHKHSTWQDVHNLLESCGFSPSSGYYIVRQGKVTALAKMKDSERLDLLMDIAGTKFYDSQRADSLKIILESNQRQEQITESLDYITSRLQQLSAEQEELQEYERVESDRRALEYLIQQREQVKITTDRNNYKSEKEEILQDRNELRDQLDDLENQIKNYKDHVESLNSDIKNYQLTRTELQTNKDKSIKTLSKAEIRLNELTDKKNNTRQHQEEVQQALDAINEKIEKNKEKFTEIDGQFKDIANQKAEIDGIILGLEARIGGQNDSSKQANDELQKATQEVEKSQNNFEKLSADISRIKEQIDNLSSNLQQSQELFGKTESERDDAQLETTTKSNKRKELWRKLHLIQNQIKQKE